MFDAQDFAARLTAREDRWPLLKGWGEAWCASFHKSEGCFAIEIDRAENSLGVKLPSALRELYSFGGHRLSKMNDPLIKIEDLEFVQNFLPFWAENQYVVTWGIRLNSLALDDPPVCIDFSGCDASGRTPSAPNRLALQNETLSEFVLQKAVGDYMQWGPNCEDFRGEGEVAKLLQAYQPLGFPDWVHEHFERGVGDVLVTKAFYGNEANLALVTADSHARITSRDQERFLRHTTKGR